MSHINVLLNKIILFGKYRVAAIFNSFRSTDMEFLQKIKINNPIFTLSKQSYLSKHYFRWDKNRTHDILIAVHNTIVHNFYDETNGANNENNAPTTL